MAFQEHKRSFSCIMMARSALQTVPDYLALNTNGLAKSRLVAFDAKSVKTSGRLEFENLLANRSQFTIPYLIITANQRQLGCGFVLDAVSGQQPDLQLIYWPLVDRGKITRSVNAHNQLCKRGSIES